MKFTWGHGMVLVLIIYMSFILSFVFKLNISELVTEDYYTEEVRYQSLIDRKKNYKDLKEKPLVETKDKEIRISFPAQFNSENVVGTLELFRPSDAKRDIKIPIILDQKNIQRIPTVNLLKGKYYVIVDWKSNNTQYNTKQTIKIK